MINHNISLEYELNSGWLNPWVEALHQGSALAWQCSACDSASFAPERTCRCGQNSGRWHPLSGIAVLESRTDGADGSFALVRFIGSDTSVVVALEGIDLGQTHGQLMPYKFSDGGVPRMVIGPHEGVS